MSVLETKPEGKQFLSLKLAPELENSRFDFRPGQYVKISNPKTKHEGVFAIASEPEEKRFIEFLVKHEGRGIAHDLSGAKMGEHFRVSPAMGKGYTFGRLRGRNILLIGMGSSLSPLRSVLKSILRRDREFGEIILVYGVRTAEDIPYGGDFDFWAKKIKVCLALSQADQKGWSGFSGRVTALLPTLKLDPEKTIACICGSHDMEREVKEILEQAGFKKENILINY